MFLLHRILSTHIQYIYYFYVYYYFCLCFCTQATTPPPMKKSKAEKTIEKAINTFITYQRTANEQYRKDEEEHWQKEMELEERRQEDRNHEITMMQML